MQAVFYNKLTNVLFDLRRVRSYETIAVYLTSYGNSVIHNFFVVFLYCRPGSVFVNFTLEFKSGTDSPLKELEQGISGGKLGNFLVVPNSLSLAGEGTVWHYLLWCCVHIEVHCGLFVCYQVQDHNLYYCI